MTLFGKKSIALALALSITLPSVNATDLNLEDSTGDALIKEATTISQKQTEGRGGSAQVAEEKDLENESSNTLEDESSNTNEKIEDASSRSEDSTDDEAYVQTDRSAKIKGNDNSDKIHHEEAHTEDSDDSDVNVEDSTDDEAYVQTDRSAKIKGNDNSDKIHHEEAHTEDSDDSDVNVEDSTDDEAYVQTDRSSAKISEESDKNVLSQKEIERIKKQFDLEMAAI